MEISPPQRASSPFTPFHPFVKRVGVKGCACIKSKNFSPKDKALTQRIVDIFHSLSHIKHYLPIFSTFPIDF